MSTRIGLGFAAFPFSGPEAFWRWVDTCEDSQIDSLWLSERLVSPQPFLEPLATLAAIGGRTSRIKFGMNTTVLPLRDPLVLAKECATIDYLSNGRFLPMFGVGNDIAPEWKALGMDTRGRGQRSNEMLQILEKLWGEDNVSFEGKYYHYDNVTISPKPKQNPLPLWIGGSSEAAIERTAKYGTGWLAGAAQPPEQLSRVIGAIHERAAANGRSIDEDHFGSGFAFRFGSWDDPVVQRNASALAARIGKDADPKSFMAVGGAQEVIDMCAKLRATGISKFVLRPIATSDEEMIEQSRLINAEVIPTVHKMP